MKKVAVIASFASPVGLTTFYNWGLFWETATLEGALGVGVPVVRVARGVRSPLTHQEAAEPAEVGDFIPNSEELQAVEPVRTPTVGSRVGGAVSAEFRERSGA